MSDRPVSFLKLFKRVNGELNKEIEVSDEYKRQIINQDPFLKLLQEGLMASTSRKTGGRVLRVYIFFGSNGLLKIGVSNNPERRCREIEQQSGINILEQYHSQLLCNAHKIEKLMLDEYTRVNKTEWVQGDYELAIKALNNLIQEFGVLYHEGGDVVEFPR